MSRSKQVRDLLKTVYVDSKAVEYLHSRHRNDPQWNNTVPGVYIGGVFCNDFLTLRVLRNWARTITDPFNISFFVAFGVLKSKTWGPNELAKNVGVELLFGFIASLVIYTIPLAVAIIADLFVFIPHIFYFRWDAQRQYRQHAAEYVAEKGSTAELDEQLEQEVGDRLNVLRKAITYTRPLKF